MLAKTLERLIEEKLTTAREIGELTGVSTSTVYRWVARQSQPSYDSIRLLVRHLSDRSAQRSILEAFSAGTSWRVQQVDADLDYNRDGCVDHDDALDASIETVRCASDALVQIRQACADEELTREEVGGIIKVLNEVVRQCSITQQVLVKLWEEGDGKRRKIGARTVPLSRKR